jgi:ABC-2 type transport system ATP-binding protein
MAMARGGGTVLVSTHQLDTAERLSTRVAIVNHGRNIATGDLASLRQAVDAGAQESLEAIFLRLTQEAAEPAVETPRRRGWFRRG